MLNPGGNLATVTATDDAGNVTTVRRSVTYRPPLEVNENGLGVAGFGLPMGTVLAAAADALGQPDQVDAEGALECYSWIENVRFATWERFGLRLVFTDWGGTPLDPKPVPLHFVAWEIAGPGVATDRGVGWASTVGNLRNRYPDVLIGINEWAPEFAIPTTDGWIRGGFDWPTSRFLSSLQRALNERGAGLDITSEWDGPTTAAVLALMERNGIEEIEVLGELGLPPDEVRLTWLNSGPGPPCV